MLFWLWTNAAQQAKQLLTLANELQKKGMLKFLRAF